MLAYRNPHQLTGFGSCRGWLRDDKSRVFRRGLHVTNIAHAPAFTVIVTHYHMLECKPVLG
jgi:hypothetical protein